MTNFMNVENFRDSELDAAIDEYSTIMRVLPGEGENVFPLVPFALTLSLNLTLNELKQSERVKVIDKTLGDEDEFHIIRNFDNPTDLLVDGTLNGDHLAGVTTLNVTGFTTLVDGNQVIVVGDPTDYALVSHTGSTLVIYPALTQEALNGTTITVHVPVAGTGEARPHPSGRACYLIDCAAYWKEVHAAINYLEANPLPVDITGDTLTLVNHIQIGGLKGGFTLAAGMIQWAGGHFQGYTGAAWVNLDDTGGGGGWSPPTGTDGQIMVWATDDWYASSLATFLAAEIQFVIGATTWSFTEALTSIPTALQTGDINADDVSGVIGAFDLIRAESGAFTSINADLSQAGGQTIIGFDPAGYALDVVGGFIAAVMDLDAETPPIEDYYTTLCIIGKPLRLRGHTSIFADADSIELNSIFVVNPDYSQTKTYLNFEPQSDYPLSPANGDVLYHDSDGLRVYQAGAWHSFAYGAITGWPTPGIGWAVIRYNPDDDAAEWTDQLRVQPEGVYIEKAVRIGARDSGMEEHTGLIEFRNNDFLGYVNDPDGALIEVSLTNIDPSQRFPIGVEGGHVNGAFGIGITTIHLKDLVSVVTDGEYIQFEGQSTLYQIVSHLPATGPTITVVISPGLVSALVDNTNCVTRQGRTLYYGTDLKWHSTDSLRIVDNAETAGEKLARVTRIQIGADGSNGYAGTIKWDSTGAQFQWHDGSSWREWPITSTLPIPTAAGMFIVSEETSPSVFTWVTTDALSLTIDEVVFDRDIRVPGIVLTDGIVETILLPGEFSFPAIEADSAAFTTLTVIGSGSQATIDSLYVKNLYVIGGTGPSPEPAALSGPRLDLIANVVGAYTYSLLPTYILGSQKLDLVVNVQMIGQVNGDYVIGNTVIDLNGLTAEVQNGSRIRFDGDPYSYIIQSHLPSSGPTTSVTIAAPGLYQPLADLTACYTDATAFDSIFTATLTTLTIHVATEIDDLHVTDQATFDHTIQIGDEGLAPEQPGMIRYNGDFQGRLEDGNWVSFTRTMADGSFSSPYGSILWWDNTKWTKNANVSVSATGVLSLAADITTPGTPAGGQIRWTGADFEGYNGSVWTSLSGYGGAPALPPGTGYEGATLRWDDVVAQWRVNPNLLSNGYKTEAALLQIGDYARFTDYGTINHVGGYVIGDKILAVDAFTGPVIDGAQILIDGDVTVHTIISHTPAIGPTTSITIEDPGLIANVADNAEIAVVDALPTQTTEGGMIRYNQNDYEGFIDGVGWASFTGHRSWLPTLEGDPSLQRGNILVYNGSVWVASHETICYSDVFKFYQPVFMRSGLELLGLLKAEAIVIGSKMPESVVDISTTNGTVIANPTWAPGTDHYAAGETLIYVNKEDWEGTIVVGAQVQIGEGATLYTIEALTPGMGNPATIELTSGLVEDIYPGDAVQVPPDTTTLMPLPQAGTVIFNKDNNTFWGYDGVTWRGLISPIQGMPFDNQVLRFVAADGYWEPAQVGSRSLLLLEDDENLSTNPIRIDDNEAGGWKLESKYNEGGGSPIYSFIVRSHSIVDPFPLDEHPYWENEDGAAAKDIWLEFSTGYPAQVGPVFKINATYSVFKAVTCTTIDTTALVHLAYTHVNPNIATFIVEGRSLFNARIKIASGNLLMDDGDLYINAGNATISGTLLANDLQVTETAYIGTWLRIGYAESTDAPIGAIRYSTPGNVTRGDWEGWDGIQWVSFTAGFHGQAIWGVAEQGRLVYFDETYEGGKWTVLPSIYVDTISMNIDVPLTLNSELILDDQIYAAKVGAIRFTGVDFEASVDGINWLSLTAGSVGGLPDGSISGDTLYWWRQLDATIDTGTVVDDGLHPDGYSIGTAHIDYESLTDPVASVLVFNLDPTEYYVEASYALGGDVYRIYLRPTLQNALALATDAQSWSFISAWLPTSLINISLTTTKINNVFQLELYESILESNRPEPRLGMIRCNESDYEGYITNVGWVSFTGMKHWADPAEHIGEFLISNGTGWVASDDAIKYLDGILVITTQINMSPYTIYAGTVYSQYSYMDSLNLIPRSEPLVALVGNLYFDSDDAKIKVCTAFDPIWQTVMTHDNELSERGIVYNDSLGTLRTEEDYAYVKETADSGDYPDGTYVFAYSASEHLCIKDSVLESYWYFSSINPDLGGANLYLNRSPTPGIAYAWLSLKYSTGDIHLGTFGHHKHTSVYGTLSIFQTTGPELGELYVEGNVIFVHGFGLISGLGEFSVPLLLTSATADLLSADISVSLSSSINEAQTIGYQRIGNFNVPEEESKRKTGDVRYTGAIRAAVDGVHEIGLQTIDIKDYPDEIADGSLITFLGDVTSYAVISHTGSPTTQIVIDLGLVKALTDEQELVVWNSGDWQGWNGSYWVSFTQSGAIPCVIYGIPEEAFTIRYNALAARWEADGALQIASTGDIVMSETLQVDGMVFSDELQALGSTLYLGTDTRTEAFTITDTNMTIKAQNIGATVASSYGLTVEYLNSAYAGSATFDYASLTIDAVSKSTNSGNALGGNTLSGIDIINVNGNGPFGTSLHSAYGIRIRQVQTSNAGDAFGLYIGPVTQGSGPLGLGANAIYTNVGLVHFGDSAESVYSTHSIKLDVRQATTQLLIDGLKVLTTRQAAIANMSTTYIFPGSWSGESTNVATAINAITTKINSILAVLRTHGIIAT
jgi:hypothetical protein